MKEWKKYVEYWGYSLEAGERIRAHHNTLAYIAVFIEYYPMTLNEWLTTK